MPDTQRAPQPPFEIDVPAAAVRDGALAEIRRFTWQGRPCEASLTAVAVADRRVAVETLTNEFWTSRQRAANGLHEISYRACFKPQLPRFFIERLTAPGQVVYDPFMGRGTTVLEAALLGRAAVGCDVNPLSAILAAPRLAPPAPAAVQARLDAIDFSASVTCPDELRVFYHPETLHEICALRAYLLDRERRGVLDAVDRWIRMVAVNRLTGHSAGFFSVYTLPPNQALSIASQRRVNAERRQVPPRRRVPDLILRKTRSLLRHCGATDLTRLQASADRHRLLTGPCHATPGIPDDSVDLVVTSPPFLDVVDYAGDNWLRGWFCGIDPSAVGLTIVRRLDEWQAHMSRVFTELARVVRPGGHIAFEVGEVRNGRVRLEEAVLPCGLGASLEPLVVLINAQRFTKTANCWGVRNNAGGTNTNRIVLWRKPLPSVRRTPARLPAAARRWIKAEAGTVADRADPARPRALSSASARRSARRTAS